MNIQTESHKNPEQLEREVDERRAHISETLHALEERLSPAHLIDQVLVYARRNGGEFSQNLVDTVKQNPIPTLLTAVGIAGLLYGHNHSTPSSTQASIKRSTSADLGAGLSQTLSDTKHQLSDASERIRQRAQQTKAQLRHQSRDLQRGLEQMLTTQPLVVGALGIGLGALIGAALPSTAQEDRIMGSTRDRLFGRAAGAMRDAAQTAAERADKFSRNSQSSAVQDRPSYQ